MSDPTLTWKEIDLNAGGKILFDEFCQWAILKNLDLEDDDDDLWINKLNNIIYLHKSIVLLVVKISLNILINLTTHIIILSSCLVFDLLYVQLVHKIIQMRIIMIVL